MIIFGVNLIFYAVPKREIPSLQPHGRKRTVYQSYGFIAFINVPTSNLVNLKRAKAIVQAVTYYNDPKVLANVSEDLGEPMVGINIETIPTHQLLAERGW
ncbi:4834_t:CDS:2 [Entrophospora sp. SA101]|nr:4834_t:CDS:2 [Entrophospora sp. SA101]